MTPVALFSTCQVPVPPLGAVCPGGVSYRHSTAVSATAIRRSVPKESWSCLVVSKAINHAARGRPEECLPEPSSAVQEPGTASSASLARTPVVPMAHGWSSPFLSNSTWADQNVQVPQQKPSPPKRCSSPLRTKGSDWFLHNSEWKAKSAALCLSFSGSASDTSMHF